MATTIKCLNLSRLQNTWFYLNSRSKLRNIMGLIYKNNVAVQLIKIIQKDDKVI